MTARLLVAERMPRIYSSAPSPFSTSGESLSEPLLCQPQLPVEGGGVVGVDEANAKPEATILVPSEAVLLSGMLYDLHRTPSRGSATTMQSDRDLLSRLAMHRPAPRHEASGGAGAATRHRLAGSFAPSLQNCSFRNQRVDAFGEHVLSVRDESRRAASAFTQGQNPRTAEATIYLGFRDPCRGGRLTRRIPVWMGDGGGYGATAYLAASRPCFRSFDVRGDVVADRVLENIDVEDGPSQ